MPTPDWDTPSPPHLRPLGSGDLELRSTTGSGRGFFIQNNVDDVLIHNVRIEEFDVGVYVAGSNACTPATGCDGDNERIRLEHSKIVDNHFVGWLGASIHGVIAHSGDRDFFGLPRTAPPDRGALEWSASALFNSGFEDPP